MNVVANVPPDADRGELEHVCVHGHGPQNGKPARQHASPLLDERLAPATCPSADGNRYLQKKIQVNECNKI